MILARKTQQLRYCSILEEKHSRLSGELGTGDHFRSPIPEIESRLQVPLARTPFCTRAIDGLAVEIQRKQIEWMLLRVKWSTAACAVICGLLRLPTMSASSHALRLPINATGKLVSACFAPKFAAGRKSFRFRETRLSFQILVEGAVDASSSSAAGSDRSSADQPCLGLLNSLR